MAPVKRVAVIGLGPAGAITIDALAQEKTFDVIRVFERREAAGGCWIEDKDAHPELTNFSALATRTSDCPVQIPDSVPARVPNPDRTIPRYTESSVYPYLETNVDASSMSFSQEAIPVQRSERSIAKHGEETPFRHHSVIRDYILSLVNRNGYDKLVSYDTTVEKCEKINDEWKLTLRREAAGVDVWWEECFDAVIVASGHYSVPYIPAVKGVEEFATKYPGSVKHSKMFRGRDAYKDKRVVIVGASVSAADIAVDILEVTRGPVYAVIKGHQANSYFGDEAFNHPSIVPKPSLSHVTSANGERTVHFVDGTSVSDVDEILFATGYTWSLPFLPHVEVKNNRIPNLYQHVIWQEDPTMMFVGAVGAGFTFKIFEWQAVLAARLLSGRATLPSLEERKQWEKDRIAKVGNGPAFTLVYPHFEEYFETLRALAGEPKDGVGRELPRWDRAWDEAFMAGHEMRKKWWREQNERAINGLKNGGAIP